MMLNIVLAKWRMLRRRSAVSCKPSLAATSSMRRCEPSSMSASNAVLSESGAFRSCFSCTTLRIDWPKFVATTQSWVAPAANSKSDWTK